MDISLSAYNHKVRGVYLYCSDAVRSAGEKDIVNTATGKVFLYVLLVERGCTYFSFSVVKAICDKPSKKLEHF